MFFKSSLPCQLYNSATRCPMNSCILLFCQWGNAMGQNLYLLMMTLIGNVKLKTTKTLLAIHPNTQINQIFNDFTVTRHNSFQNKILFGTSQHKLWSMNCFVFCVDLSTMIYMQHLIVLNSRSKLILYSYKKSVSISWLTVIFLYLFTVWCVSRKAGWKCDLKL